MIWCDFVRGNGSKMMIFILLLCNAIDSMVYAFADGRSNFPSGIRTRTNPNSTNVITIAFGGYTDLCERSQVIVDKSLFVKAFLADTTKVQVVTYPHTWGKTIVAYMLKSFFEARFESDGKRLRRERMREYKYFTKGNLSTPLKKIWFSFPPLISKSVNIVEKFCRTYPVIMVDFSRFYPENDTETLYDCFAHAIAQSFKQHSYAAGILRKKSTEVRYDSASRRQNEYQLKIYRDFQNPLVKKSRTDLQTSIQFLTEILKNIHYTPVLVILNDYDSLIRRMYFEMDIAEVDRQEFMKFFITFIDSIFVRNTALFKGIVLGELKMEFLKHHHDFRHAYPFFGFSKEEVTKLFNHRIPLDMWEDGYKWYGGYKMGCEHEPLFSCGSIARFLNSKKFDNYFEKTHNASFIKTLMNYRDLKNMFESLVMGYAQRLEFTPSYCFNSKSLSFLRKLFKGEHREPLSVGNLEVILYYLQARGFLSGRYSNMPYKRGSIHMLTIPNIEVGMTIMKRMMYHYFDVFGRNIAYHVRYASTVLMTTIQEDRNGSTIAELESKFSNLFQSLHNETNNGTELIRDDQFLHDVIFSVVLVAKLQNHYVLTKSVPPGKGNDTYDHSTSIFLTDQQNRTVTELKFDFNTQNATVLLPTNISLNDQVRVFQFVGVRVNETGGVKILYKVDQIPASVSETPYTNLPEHFDDSIRENSSLPEHFDESKRGENSSHSIVPSGDLLNVTVSDIDEGNITRVTTCSPAADLRTENTT